MKDLIAILLLWFGVCDNFQTIAYAADLDLETSESILHIDDSGRIEILSKSTNKAILVSRVDHFYEVVLHSFNKNRDYLVDLNMQFQISEENDKIIFLKKDYYLREINTKIDLQFEIQTKSDVFVFTGELVVHSDDWQVKTLRLLTFDESDLFNKEHTIYWPRGLGETFSDQDHFGSKKLKFPGRATMPWYAITTDDIGLYIGVHDSLQRPVDINLNSDLTSSEFYSDVEFPIYDHRFKLPEIVIKCSNEEWYDFSIFYRKWFDKHFDVTEAPEWVVNDNGWLLAILKQQNGNLMWPYADIDKLCDIAKEFGLTTLGLFGWANGGHDNLYPNYAPDQLSGGKVALQKAIKRAQSRGIRIVLYANGKLIDSATDYYKYHGIETIMLTQNKRPIINYYVKHNNYSPVIFTVACNGASLWRKTMLDLAVQAESLGADGILYDQLGVFHPDLCFSALHDHPMGHSDSEYRLKMINDIKKEVRKNNSEFIVMTEATNNNVIRGIDYTHGWGNGYQPSKNAFPDLYLFTFPEVISTQRNPNPVVSRYDANFAAIHGLRHEIECRYSADVEYLKNGTVPTPESYSTVNSPPNIKMLNEISFEESKKYLYDLIAFENKHHEFFREGEFISDNGFSVIGDNIIAKGFKSQDKIGIVVWNKDEEKSHPFQLKINKGYKIVDRDGLQQTKKDLESNVLSPNSLRLIIIQKVVK